jgi:hypothetical protein
MLRTHTKAGSPLETPSLAALAGCKAAGGRSNPTRIDLLSLLLAEPRCEGCDQAAGRKVDSQRDPKHQNPKPLLARVCKGVQGHRASGLVAAGTATCRTFTHRALPSHQRARLPLPHRLVRGWADKGARYSIPHALGAQPWTGPGASRAASAGLQERASRTGHAGPFLPTALDLLGFRGLHSRNHQC